jgi:hypothetical protein
MTSNLVARVAHRERTHQVPVVFWQTPVAGWTSIEYGLMGAPLG